MVGQYFGEIIMSKRMRELAEQAGMYIIDDEFSTYGKFAEKFAELIVKECAGKVDFILREKSNGGGTMGDEIREHFGVKE